MAESNAPCAPGPFEALDEVEDHVLLGVGASARVTKRATARGAQGYDPDDPESVAQAERLLQERLGQKAPALVHKDPSFIDRVWRFFVGGDA